MSFFDLSLPKSNQKKHSKLFPNSIRACIIGKSGSGKTNLLLNFLLKIGFLDYDHIYLFGKSLHQPEYQFLIECLENGYDKDEILDLIAIYKTSQTMPILSRKESNPIAITYGIDVLDPELLDPREKNLVIFDDLMLEKQQKIENYFTRGRHNNIDSFYLSQNYTEIPSHTVRENCNFFILFPQDHRTLLYFHGNHCKDIGKDKFLELCRMAWDIPYGFVTIDINATDKKYRKMLDYRFKVQI
jgi:Poxvirus A32 protein